ncbi:MAG: isoaspartyl peptidase/L-asparaginase family protein [Candidatus Hydrothermia bacterium]|jgi:beta-aspartyl-peptidase (threonine type)
MIIVHGGAGEWNEEKLKIAESSLIKSVEKGLEILKKYDDPISACEEAIKILEDEPIFNAGTGSVLNIFGEVEMDASIMRGDNLKAGAVAGIKNIKNPISLARKIMEETEHVLIISEGAQKLAKTFGFEEYNPITNESIEKYKKAKENFDNINSLKHIKQFMEKYPNYFIGTVGAVVVNSKGVIVSGSSTGGTILKLKGRVGDTPLIGAGIYANEVCGASATGIGEGIIRVNLSSFVCYLVKIGISVENAVKSAIDYLTQKVNLPAGIIALDNYGNVGFYHNTKYMPVAYYKDGKIQVKFSYFT